MGTEARRNRRPPGSLPRSVIAAAGALMLLAAVDCIRCLPMLFESRQRAAGLRAELARLRRSNGELATQVRALRDDPRAIEALARGELGMLRPGEVLFIIVDQPADAGDRRPH